mgnify:CR=1 FL=1
MHLHAIEEQSDLSLASTSIHDVCAKAGNALPLLRFSFRFCWKKIFFFEFLVAIKNTVIFFFFLGFKEFINGNLAVLHVL